MWYNPHTSSTHQPLCHAIHTHKLPGSMIPQVAFSLFNQLLQLLLMFTVWELQRLASLKWQKNLMASFHFKDAKRLQSNCPLPPVAVDAPKLALWYPIPVCLDLEPAGKNPNCTTSRMTSWWLLVRPRNPCLLHQEIDLSNVAKSQVRRIQNKEALRVLLYNNNHLSRHGYMHVCMHIKTPKAFKRLRQNSEHDHTKLDVRKRTTTNCANFKLSAWHFSLDSTRSSVWQLGLFQCLRWKKTREQWEWPNPHGKTASGSAMAIWARVELVPQSLQVANPF